MLKQLTVLLLVGLALAAIVAGCGDGDEGSGEATAAPTPTKAEFIAKADAICREDSKDLARQISDELRETDGSQAEFVDAAESVLPPVIETRLEKIRALGVPKGDEKQIDAYFAAMEESLADVQARPAATFYAYEARFEPAAKIAREYGMQYCG